VDVKIIRFAATGDQIFCRRAIRWRRKKCDQNGMSLARFGRGKGAVLRDLAEFGFGSNKDCHLVAQRFPKMAFNLRPEPFFVPPAGLEDNIAAGNKSFDPREAEELKLTPQSFHLYCPPAHVDRTEKSKEPRHARSSA
jgi:hypothetical protein